MSAFSDVVAKIVTLVDSVLDVYVDTSIVHSNSSCIVDTYSGNMTTCGESLIQSFSSLFYTLSSIYNYFIGGIILGS